jgi:hypothetical protein
VQAQVHDAADLRPLAWQPITLRSDPISRIVHYCGAIKKRRLFALQLGGIIL